jgi:hypothetical protein
MGNDELVMKALQILAKAKGQKDPGNHAVAALSTRPASPADGLKPGDLVEWLSPALPRKQGEVLAVHPNGTFEVWHPLTEILCRLPMGWITRVTRPTNMDGQS